MVRKIILSGSACSGKTSLVDVLRESNFQVLDEVARELIEMNLSSGSEVLPWNGKVNLYKFQFSVMYNQILQEEEISSGLCFLDRSLIDSLGYCLNGGINPPPMLTSEISKADYEKVFFLEILPEKLYKQDMERRESYPEALVLQAHLLEAYKKSGLELIFLPNKYSIEERKNIILENI